MLLSNFYWGKYKLFTPNDISYMLFVSKSYMFFGGAKYIVNKATNKNYEKID